MNAGRLRQYVQLQSATETRDTSGRVNKTWATYARVYAEVLPVNARGFSSFEQPEGAHMTTEITHIVTIRYRDDVASTHRLVWGTRTLQFKGSPVDPTGKRHILEVQAKELE